MAIVVNKKVAKKNQKSSIKTFDEHLKILELSYDQFLSMHKKDQLHDECYLDYSEESLKDIDKLLLSKYKFYKSEGLEFSDYTVFFHSLYIIKVFEKNHECGVMSFDNYKLKYVWRNMEIFPHTWCINKAKYGGKADNIYFKYHECIKTK